jgi:protein-L-isoaspartate(D-aspartate) O-methyltransferase
MNATDIIRLVPRAPFIPDVIWTRRADGWAVPLHKDEHPDEWLKAVESENGAVITQVDDGKDPTRGIHPTSSSSAPMIMAQMINALELEAGMNVLEIGTGTGYNAAVLSTLGADRITTIELDETIAEQARKSLETGGYQICAVVGDGSFGYPPNAPYDRVIATASAETIPYPWIEQTRPGGRIVAPVAVSFHETAALAALDIHDDGTAQGPFVGDVSFMRLRGQRPELVELDDSGPYDTSTIETDLRDVIEGTDYTMQFVMGLMVPGIQEGRIFEFAEEDGHPSPCVRDPKTGSWASFTPAEDGRHLLRQHGPRRLMDELCHAYGMWQERRRPNVTRFGLTITPTSQRPWLDAPGQ